MELEPHNMLAAHMFHVLTGCQAMQQLQINVSKNNTIHTLLHKQFPAIKSSDNQPTYYVTPKTIGYSHWIVTDCITRLPTDACTQCALQNEIMILLRAREAGAGRLTPGIVQHPHDLLRGGSVHVLRQTCAGRRPKPKHFKRRMIVGRGAAGVGETATEEDDEQPPPPAADDNQSCHPPCQETVKTAWRVECFKGVVLNKPA